LPPSSLALELHLSGEISEDALTELREAGLGDLSRQHFSSTIREALRRFSCTSLITEIEIQAASLYEALSFEAQTTYIRLLQRKSIWFQYGNGVDKASLGWSNFPCSFSKIPPKMCR
jgi:hypothetical protein